MLYSSFTSRWAVQIFRALNLLHLIRCSLIVVSICFILCLWYIYLQYLDIEFVGKFIYLDKWKFYAAFEISLMVISYVELASGINTLISTVYILVLWRHGFLHGFETVQVYNTVYTILFLLKIGWRKGFEFVIFGETFWQKMFGIWSYFKWIEKNLNKQLRYVKHHTR